MESVKRHSNHIPLDTVNHSCQRYGRAAENSEHPFKLFEFSTALRLRPCVISYLGVSRFSSAVEILSPRQHNEK